MSVAWICTAGWSPKAIRVSAERGSPWLPVHRITTSCGSVDSSARGLIRTSSSTDAYPRLRAMFRFRIIERPITHTLRWLLAAAASITC